MPTNVRNSQLTRVVCWTRMQAEAGQELEEIVQRKEVERKAGDGLFFWGIGNAPNRSIGHYAAKGGNVDVVFSRMKTAPKSRDKAPSGILVWQTYFDNEGVETDIPAHVLVTSRTNSPSKVKRVHYALVCSSTEELRIDDHGPFDPQAYRNVSENAKPVGASQVTALVRKTTKAGKSPYRVNFRARLTGSYWVKLGKPILLKEKERKRISNAFANLQGICNDSWLNLISEVRKVPKQETQRTRLI